MILVRHWRSFVTVMAVFAISSAAGSLAAAQDESSPGIETTRTARVQTDETDETDETTDETDETTDESGEGEETDADEESVEANPNAADIDITGTDQTIAQGLAAFDAFSNGIWRITELSPLGAEEAPSVTAPYYGFLYQMDGTTIVRNDVSGKRARLEPGEGYFFSANDAYTRYKEQGSSRAWLIEIVPEDFDEDDTAGIVIFDSGEIDGFPNDTRDLELLAANVPEDGTATVQDYTADALIMVTVGSLEVTDAQGTVRMDAPAALLVTSELEIENTSGEPANYLIAKIGPAVAEVAPLAEATETTDEESTDESTDETTEDEVDPMLDSDGDSLIDTDEAVYGTDPYVAVTDYDGYTDGDEVIIYGTDPLDPNSWP
jgi:hypothetical protein